MRISRNSILLSFLALKSDVAGSVFRVVIVEQSFAVEDDYIVVAVSRDVVAVLWAGR